MPTVHLARILRDLGTTSTRELLARTGAPGGSVYRAGQVAAIDALYALNRGFRGPFGFPLEETRFEGPVAVRDYAGGQILFRNNGPQGPGETTVVTVRFVGFHCLQESDSDQASGSDEPYFIIGVASANASTTQRFGPYEGVDSGTVRFEAADIVGLSTKMTPPIVLGVVAMEHDEGTPEEAEGKVRDAIVEIERTFEQAVGTFTGVSTDNHVMPQWARDIYIGWVPEWGAALFGLADDEIGKMPVVLFDFKADLKEWRAPPVRGTHGMNEYNVTVPIDGGSQGRYDLFFKVDLFKDPGPSIEPYGQP